MRPILVLVLLLGSLTGCESVSVVVPTGKDTYMLTVKGCDGALLFGASCATTGVNAANKFCERKGLVATVSQVDATTNWGIPQHGQVQFTCTDAAHSKLNLPAGTSKQG
jgi:hypothetical protein